MRGTKMITAKGTKMITAKEARQLQDKLQEVLCDLDTQIREDALQGKMANRYLIGTVSCGRDVLKSHLRSLGYSTKDVDSKHGWCLNISWEEL